ncbi:MAG: PIN domain-containing protein [Chloroflexia bacterium]|nr:PIN domain-containing protein [Chloroflexia bacterium]
MTTISSTDYSATIHRTFIDSNIWLYAFIRGQDAQKAQHANHIITTTPNICVSTQVVTEVCANIIKYRLLDETEIRVLIDTFYVKHIVIDVGYGVLREASLLREQVAVSYWDSTIMAAALESGATVLLSEDMQDGFVLRDQLTIINPFTERGQ